MPSFKNVRDEAEMEQILSRYRPAATANESIERHKMQLLQDISIDIRRVADRLDPKPRDMVGTPYVANRLGITTAWVTDLIRKGEIKNNCIVPGTGNGKPWKFFKQRIDRWVEER